ncbi:MAG: phenylalanine--tRNA ligase subunit beta, partial [Candidatus Eiseniibacteriota bacterium]
LQIESDAAERFAQGVDPEGVAIALDATARLLAEIASGDVSAQRVDQYPGRREASVIELSTHRASALLGLPVDEKAATESLQSLEIARVAPWSAQDGGAKAQFRAPSFRFDLLCEEDLIEEIARVIGYDKIPTRVRSVASPMAQPSPEEGAARRIIEISCGLGFHEAVSTCLVGEIPAPAREGIAPDAIWELQNPMSRELKHLRVGLLPGLLEAAARNLHHGVADVRLAEVGKVFLATPPPLGSERYEAALILAGLPDEWNQPGREQDRFLELKGAVQALLEALGIDSFETRAYHGMSWKRGTGAQLTASERRLGEIGEVDPSLGSSFGLDRPAWAAVLDVLALAEKAEGLRRYQPIPRFPASKRDLAVIVPKDVPHAELTRVIRKAGGALLGPPTLFDVFEGSSIGPGRKSMAYALEFRAPDRTLEDQDVDALMASIHRALAAELGAAIRGAAPGSASED